MCTCMHVVMVRRSGSHVTPCYSIERERERETVVCMYVCMIPIHTYIHTYISPNTEEERVSYNVVICT